MYRTSQSVMIKDSYSYIRVNSVAHNILDYIKNSKWIPLINVKDYTPRFHYEPYNRLLKQGFIIVKVNPKDKRGNLIKLTAKGRQAIKLLNKKM